MYQCNGCGHLTEHGRRSVDGVYPTKRCPACKKKRIFFWVPTEEEIEQACTGILFAERQAIADGTHTGRVHTLGDEDDPEGWTPQEIVVMRSRGKRLDGEQRCDCPYWNHEH